MNVAFLHRESFNKKTFSDLCILILSTTQLIYLEINIEKFNWLIMLNTEWDKTTYLVMARISFGRTALHRKLTIPPVFSTFLMTFHHKRLENTLKR